jgi:hypothetical protein
MSPIPKKWPVTGYPEKVAKQLGWNGIGGEKAILECLEATDPFELIKVYELLVHKGEIKRFIPIVEPYESDNCLLSKDFKLMAREAWSNNIDVMIGGSSMESVFLLDLYKHIKDGPNDEAIIQKLMAESMELGDIEKSKIYGEKIKQLYCGNSEISLRYPNGYLEFLNDFLCWYDVYRTVLGRMNSGGSGKTYLYIFDYDIEMMNYTKTFTDFKDFKGATHYDDRSYMFKSIFTPAPQKGTPGYVAMKKVIALFTSFVKNGNPNNKEIGDVILEPVKAKSAHLNCFTINENCENLDLPQTEKFAVWDSFFEMEGNDLY